ncbi:hypothetical protein BV20DRAFT_317339 [Pilatotrama ljubarskyi]|nr:hypothetical protein BV20DRAFT_317339 [Pilatotrama ljubarskyi]
MSRQAIDPVEEPEVDDAEESDEYEIEDEEGESGAVEEEEEEEEEEAEGAQGSSLTALLLGGEMLDREALRLLKKTRTKTRTMSTKELTSRDPPRQRQASSVVGRKMLGLPLARARYQATTESSRKPKKASRRGLGPLRMRTRRALLKQMKMRRKCNARRTRSDSMDYRRL